MSLGRIYQNAALQPGAVVDLDERASHYLARVLRARTGDSLILFNGQGGEYQAVIRRIDKKGVAAEIHVFTAFESESPIDIYLAQGIAKGEKMDFIVQKAVELGVRKIMPLVTERGNVRLDGERESRRLQHWQSVVISACEQSGRNHLPEVAAPAAYRDWLPQAEADLRFVLSPHVADRLPDRQLPPRASVLLLIGPEGGLSAQEVEQAVQKGFLPLNLGPRVLRTETAALAAITAIQVKYGDLG